MEGTLGEVQPLPLHHLELNLYMVTLLPPPLLLFLPIMPMVNLLAMDPRLELALLLPVLYCRFCKEAAFAPATFATNADGNG
uniref:Uncharacterized protein n=1 Tax=Picea glauca TaxID=3330 RepID=A0A101M1J1_PICGL|nr:hypothetical protein ABT39_MTgene3773 [Picea glauca]